MSAGPTMTEPAGLRDATRAGAQVRGTFVKTPAPHVVELLGLSGLDFVAIDAEHGPFDRAGIDLMALAARAVGVPLMVRVAALDPAAIGGALDCGAAGVIVPHVRTAREAEDAVAAVRYAGGRRGFSPSTRAAGYGTRAAGHAARSDQRTSLWCQIEDEAALGQLDAIAAVEGVDCLFAGPADLALSLGLDPQDGAALAPHLATIAAAAGRHGIAAGIFVGAPGAIADAVDRGFRVVICGSDQSALLGFGRTVAAS